MLRVGLTGGLACGKTIVGAMMASRGAHVIQADTIAHDLMKPGQPIYEEVMNRFGREIVKTDGSIDRGRLAEAAFGAGRIAELNQIVHPAVIERQELWMGEVGERDPSAIAVVEAALILEAGVNRRFDKLVVVTCSREQKIERFVLRVTKNGRMDDASARAEAERRMAAQLPEEDKVKVADFVIDNSGDLAATEAQVEKLMQRLRKSATASSTQSR